MHKSSQQSHSRDASALITPHFLELQADSALGVLVPDPFELPRIATNMIAWPRAMVRLVEFSFILAARLAFARHEEQHRQQRAQQGTLDDRGEVQAGMRVIARAKAHQLLQ